MIASISSAGVTSNDGFHTFIRAGAVDTETISPLFILEESPWIGPLTIVNSESGRTSILISDPLCFSRSIDVQGAATRNLTP